MSTPRFVGAKNGNGVWQWIISQMPPHDAYVELFAGTAAVFRHKRPAGVSWLIDKDPEAPALHGPDFIPPGKHNAAAGAGIFGDPVVFRECRDALDWLRDGEHRRLNGGWLIYADPPYLAETRRAAGRRYYRHEFSTWAQHKALLDLLNQCACPVMVSGYASELYASHLSHWRFETFQTVDRGGNLATECLWCNFPPPTALHDYRWIGRTFRERERIGRKVKRWAAKLCRMPVLERKAILARLGEEAS